MRFIVPHSYHFISESYSDDAGIEPGSPGLQESSLSIAPWPFEDRAGLRKNLSAAKSFGKQLFFVPIWKPGASIKLFSGFPWSGVAWSPLLMLIFKVCSQVHLDSLLKICDALKKGWTSPRPVKCKVKDLKFTDISGSNHDDDVM